MEAHRTEATVGGDGSVTIRGLPFQEGESVEVIVLSVAPRAEAPAERPRRQFGSARGLVSVPDDFDEPLTDFEPYT